MHVDRKLFERRLNRKLCKKRDEETTYGEKRKYGRMEIHLREEEKSTVARRKNAFTKPIK